MDTLTGQQLQDAVRTLDGWAVDGAAIVKRFEFGTFAEAMAFMAAASVRIDAMDHHPEWTNVYNRVDVRLSSHDAGGVTQRDVDLARALEDVRGADADAGR